MEKPILIGDHQMPVGVSVGISLAPADGIEADELLKNGDMALYRAKADGRGTYRFFEPEMDARMQARRIRELDLRQAVALLVRRGKAARRSDPAFDRNAAASGGRLTLGRRPRTP